jgi:hypothetical protein
MAKSEGWVANLERWVAKSEGWVANLDGWVTKLLARLHATQLSGFESRQPSKIKNKNWRCKLKSDHHTL